MTLAAHGAGQIEFQTYSTDAPGLLAALVETQTAFAERNGQGEKAKRRKGESDKKSKKQSPSTPGVNFLTVLSEYPNTELALRLFTTIENGRIDFLLRHAYRGIRRDLDFVRQRLRERRPDI